MIYIYKSSAMKTPMENYETAVLLLLSMTQSSPRPTIFLKNPLSLPKWPILL